MEHARNVLSARVMKVGMRGGMKVGEHTLAAGWDWRREAVRERAVEWEMRDSTGYSLPHTPDALHLIYALRSTNRLVAHTAEAFCKTRGDTWRRTACSM